MARGNAITRITIVTKLRFAAAAAPLILLIVAPILASGFYLYGMMPALLKDNQIAAMRAADGLEAAVYKLDWGRAQPDAAEIIKGQERRFVGWVDLARAHASTRDQLDKLERVAQTANPIFDSLRKGGSGDESIEQKLRDVLSLIADLNVANDTAMDDVVARAESRARVFMAITLIAGILVPWAVFVVLYRMSGTIAASLREIRGSVEKMTDGPSVQELTSIDESLTELGFVKPNPMLAE
jgi:hypothetical protein